MALGNLLLGGTAFETVAGATTRTRPTGLLRAYGRQWVISVVVETNVQRSALTTLFNGAKVPMTLPDGDSAANVIVTPTTLPLHDDGSVALTISEVL